MRSFVPLRDSTLSELVDLVRKGLPDEVPEATGRLFHHIVSAIPAAARSTPIDLVKWSQPFVTNSRWQEIWRDLGIETVADLGEAGTALARTRGVGRAKLLAVCQDLLSMARRPGRRPDVVGPDDRLTSAVRSSLAAIEDGPPSPHAHLVRALFRAVIDALPPEIRAWEIRALPWTCEWCYTNGIWSDLGIKVVADLANSATELARARGIGRGKVVALAEELIFLSPDLWARVHPELARRTSRPAGTRRGAGGRPDPGSLVAAIDRLAERLSPRERDVLRRRIGWRYDGEPEKLRTLAETYGVTQERIRQIESLVRKRLHRLVLIRKFPSALREALRPRPGPVPLASLVGSGNPEFSGMMEVWRPLASLLEEVGGPYLVRDPRQGDRVVVSPTADLRRLTPPAIAPDVLMRRSS